MVGSVSMLFLQDLGIGAISFWIGKKHTEHNFAARGNDLLIDYAFNQMGLKTLQSQVHIKNIASQRTVERSGFKFKKTNGKWMEYEFLNPNPPIRLPLEAL